MTTERDPRTRTVLSWLREDAHENAERVLLLALDEVDATPQRRSGWPARRFLNMSSAHKVTLAAAAVIVSVIVGYNLLPELSGPGTPTAAPTVEPSVRPTTPSVSPIATVSPVPPDGSPISPGRYALAIPGTNVKAEFTVADGWSSGGWHLTRPGSSLSFWSVSNVGSDACRAFETLPDPAIGPTVDDLVTALEAQANSVTSAPVDVIVGGHAGKRLTLGLEADLGQSCGDLIMWWLGEDGAQGRGMDTGDRNEDAVFVIDVGGKRIVLVAYPARTATVAPISEVIDSMTFATQ